MADHESCTIGEWDIILWISHFHVLCLEVPIHHETLHEEVFAEEMFQQLCSPDAY